MHPIEISKDGLDALMRIIRENQFPATPKGEPDHVYLVRKNSDGDIERRTASPKARRYTAPHVLAFAELVTLLVEQYYLDAAPLVLVNQNRLLAVLDERDGRREFVQAPLTFTAPCARLAEMARTRWHGPRDDLLRMLHVDFADVAPAEFLSLIENVKVFTEGDSKDVNTTAHRAVAKSVVSRVQLNGLDRINHEVAFEIPVFDESASIRLEPCSIRCFFDVKGDGEMFLIPRAGEINRAVRQTLDAVAEVLSQSLPPCCKVALGGEAT